MHTNELSAYIPQFLSGKSMQFSVFPSTTPHTFSGIKPPKNKRHAEKHEEGTYDELKHANAFNRPGEGGDDESKKSKTKSKSKK
jgi:hypothetical protein